MITFLIKQKIKILLLKVKSVKKFEHLKQASYRVFKHVHKVLFALLIILIIVLTGVILHFFQLSLSNSLNSHSSSYLIVHLYIFLSVEFCIILYKIYTCRKNILVQKCIHVQKIIQIYFKICFKLVFCRITDDWVLEVKKKKRRFPLQLPCEQADMKTVVFPVFLVTLFLSQPLRVNFCFHS